MTFVVTGFEPFGGDPYNPTQAAVEELARIWDGEETLITEVLPVEFVAADRRIRELIAQHSPRVVVCCGLNAQITHPELERIARNDRNARIADNAGYKPEGVPVVDGGADEMRSTLDVEGVVAALNVRGIEIGASDDAGRYVCNSTLYAVLDALDGQGQGVFFHFPDDPDRGRAADDARIIAEVLRAAVD